MTITLTGIELERMDAILEQFEYVLRRVGNLKSEEDINGYLDCVKNKWIKKFSFFGVVEGSKKAKHALYVEIDWTEHDVFVSENTHIHVPSYWGDGDNKKINPDIRDEAQKFLKKCIGL